MHMDSDEAGFYVVEIDEGDLRVVVATEGAFYSRDPNNLPGKIICSVAFAPRQDVYSEQDVYKEVKKRGGKKSRFFIFFFTPHCLPFYHCFSLFILFHINEKVKIDLKLLLCLLYNVFSYDHHFTFFFRSHNIFKN